MTHDGPRTSPERTRAPSSRPGRAGGSAPGSLAPLTLTSLLLLTGACATPRVDDPRESERPPAVTRAPRPAAAPGWDDDTPARSWPVLRAVFRLDTTARDGRRLELLRGLDRVEVEGPGDELWSYRRNPRAPTRVDALWAAPPGDELIALDHSTLLAEGLPAHWEQAVCPWIDPREVAAWPVADVPDREAFGRRFVAVRPPAGHAVVELWWDRELALPLELRHRDGTRLTLTALTQVGTAPEPRPASERRPGARVVDLADWREEQHGG